MIWSINTKREKAPAKQGAWWQRLRKDVRGNALVVVGAAMIPMVGAVGLGVDVAQWVLWKRQIHSSTDLAALAGARALADGRPVDQAVRRSLSYNDLRAFTIDAIENAPLKGDYAGDNSAVRVEVTTSQSLPFSSLFMSTPTSITVSATAQSSKSVPNCVITLDKVGTGVNITGSSNVNMNCGIASNSDMDATSSDSIVAGALSAVGTVNEGSAISDSTSVNQGIGEIEDPYAGKLPTPNAQAGCSPNSWPLIQGTITINPAIHGSCYAGLQIQGGTTTLMPGTYMIGEKGISIAAGATLIAHGVTIIFTNTASSFNDRKIGSFAIAGGATVQMSAPTTGTYAGIMVYQDPRTPDNNRNWVNITGNSSSSFEGAVYAPSVGVKFTGNSGMNTNCMQIVSMYASFEGNTSVNNQCPVGSGSSAYGGSGTVRLVE